MDYWSRVIETCGPLGLYALARKLNIHHPRILMYHRFSEDYKRGYTCQDFFQRQVAYLANNYELYSVNELACKIFDTGEIPKHAVAISVDDGYEDFYQFAYPILREHSVPATLFATTGFVNGDTWLWPDKVAWLLENAGLIQQDFYIGNVAIKSGYIAEDSLHDYRRQLCEYFLSITTAEKNQHIEALAQSLQLSLPTTVPDAYKACSWQQLYEMQNNGIEIGAHTVTHPSLTKMELASARIEIIQSYADINNFLGKRQRSFCYPNGTHNDYSQELKDIVKNAGLSNAVVAHHDSLCLQDRYELRRYSSSGNDMFQFYKAASGLQCLKDKWRVNYDV